MKTIEGRKVIEEHVVEGVIDSVNIYKYLTGKLKTIPSRKAVKKAFGRGQIILNGNRARSLDRIVNHDRIEILEYLGAVSKEYDLDLKVLFEDEFIAIVVKPPGIPTSGNQWKTLQNAIPGNLKTSSREDALSVPLTVHRLDAKTHGLVVVAKTSASRIKLGQLFEERKVKKTYTAIVQGKLQGEGVFTSKVDGKEAETKYKVLSSFLHVKDGWNTVVMLFPTTGRKHQLRVHLSEAGHPIVGDVKYSDKNNVLKGKGIFLSANGIVFDHPITKSEIELDVALPSKFERYIERMKRWNERVNKS